MVGRMLYREHSVHFIDEVINEPRLNRTFRDLVYAVGTSVAADLVAELIEHLGASEPDDAFRTSAKSIRNRFFVVTSAVQNTERSSKIKLPMVGT